MVLVVLKINPYYLLTKFCQGFVTLYQAWCDLQHWLTFNEECLYWRVVLYETKTKHDIGGLCTSLLGCKHFATGMYICKILFQNCTSTMKKVWNYAIYPASYSIKYHRSQMKIIVTMYEALKFWYTGISNYIDVNFLAWNYACFQQIQVTIHPIPSTNVCN